MTQQEKGKWLDAPDGPGWWAFEGVETASSGRESTCIERGIAEVLVTNGVMTIRFKGTSWRIDWLRGKWLLLHIDWPEKEVAS